MHAYELIVKSGEILFERSSQVSIICQLITRTSFREKHKQILSMIHKPIQNRSQQLCSQWRNFPIAR